VVLRDGGLEGRRAKELLGKKNALKADVTVSLNLPAGGRGDARWDLGKSAEGYGGRAVRDGIKRGEERGGETDLQGGGAAVGEQEAREGFPPCKNWLRGTGESGGIGGPTSSKNATYGVKKAEKRIGQGV